MRWEGAGQVDDYFMAHGAPEPTGTTPPCEESFHPKVDVVAPSFGVYSNVVLNERQDVPIGTKALPMLWAVAMVSPKVAAGLQDAVARVSVFPNRGLLGLKLFKSDHGATSAVDPLNFQPGYEDMANLPRRTFPWTRSPRVTRWPIQPQSYPDFMGGSS